MPQGLEHRHRHGPGLGSLTELHTWHKREEVTLTDERKQSKDMLNRFPLTCMHTHSYTHVVNYNYAILISKHASHLEGGSMSKSCSEPRRVACVEKAKSDEWNAMISTGRPTPARQVEVGPSYLTPPPKLPNSHTAQPLPGMHTLSFDWAYPVGLEPGDGRRGFVVSCSARPANRELLAFVILIEADVYWQLNNDSTTRSLSRQGRSMFGGKSQRWALCVCPHWTPRTRDNPGH